MPKLKQSMPSNNEEAFNRLVQKAKKLRAKIEECVGRPLRPAYQDIPTGLISKIAQKQGFRTFLAREILQQELQNFSKQQLARFISKCAG